MEDKKMKGRKEWNKSKNYAERRDG